MSQTSYVDNAQNFFAVKLLGCTLFAVKQTHLGVPRGFTVIMNIVDFISMISKVVDIGKLW